MRRNLFVSYLSSLLCVVGLLTACTDLDEKQPDNLIPESKMAAVLTDIHLAEARVSRLGLGSLDSSTLVYKRLEKQIFQKHKVDTSAYSKSYQYYSASPSREFGPSSRRYVCWLSEAASRRDWM